MARFGRQYVPVPVDVEPSIPAYRLPLTRDRIGNYDFVAGKVRLSEAAERLLLRNGLVAMRWGKRDDFVKAYTALKDAELPVYVTSDSVLHLYHVLFDEALKQIEQTSLIPALTQLTGGLIQHLLERRSAARGEDMQAGLDKAVAFLAVGHELLTDASEEIAALEGYRDRLKGQGRRWRWELETGPEPLRTAVHQIIASNSKDKRNNWRVPGPDEGRGTLVEWLNAAIARKRTEAKPLSLPAHVRTWVDRDKQAIGRHEGFSVSPIFAYREDFSQYVPRGHYTRGYDLRRYFVAMMWLGRMTFLIKGGEPHGPFAPDYLVSRQEARRQTLAACALTRALRDVKVNGKPAAELWERVYGVTAFFVGLADDLTYTEYDDALRRALGDTYAPAMLADKPSALKVKTELARLRKPAIYSGTGESGTLDPAALQGTPSAKELDKVFAKTQGFRLMGQRFVPDAYVMGKLVFPTVGAYTGAEPKARVFTCGASVEGCPPPARDKRVFARGLDVMALLGSKRATDHLQSGGDRSYRGYDKAFGDLAAQFAQLREPDGWNVNLYWSWVYCLRALLQPYGTGYQPYMATPAWQDKQLNTALASWSQLRHDTILYVKSPYTVTCGAAMRQPKDFPGYVEPVPHLYARLLALTRLTKKMLTDMAVLDETTQGRCKGLDALLTRLLGLSVKELANQPLTPDEERWVKDIGAWLKSTCCGPRTEGTETTLIADVHTDQNTGRVVEVGTGYVGLILVANRLPDGSIGLAAGPVSTCYEFKHPLRERLTDEAWRKMLGGSRDHLADRKPAFVGSYFVEK